MSQRISAILKRILSSPPSTPAGSEATLKISPAECAERPAEAAATGHWAADPYFPNQSTADMNLEYRLRGTAAHLDEISRFEVYSVISQAVDAFCKTEFRYDDECAVARQNGRDIFFPKPIPLIKFSHIVFGYEQLLERKYCLPGFVEVECDDVVVDCGGFVGGFSLTAAKKAKSLHIFEPDQQNCECVRRNFSGLSHVTVCEKGLYSRTRKMNLNISASAVEHSLLIPDDGPPIRVAEIEVVRLDDYLQAVAAGTPDFVKIEAEGVEVEVFDGLGEVRPRKLAIDVSPERNGESPAPELMSRLQPLGYTLHRRGNVLFARLPE